MCKYEKSKLFFAEFSNLFETDSITREQAVSSYTHNTDFTEFIISGINEIIKRMGLQSQTEYYRIDSTGYKKRWHELPKKSGFNPHLWDLQIAVEHENNDKDWLDEVIKLAHICCPLRVVIGYVPADMRPDEDIKRLSYAADALKMLNCINNIKDGEFMIILGNSKTKSEKDYFNYKAYVLDSVDMSFIPLL